MCFKQGQFSAVLPQVQRVVLRGEAGGWRQGSGGFERECAGGVGQ